MDADAPSSECSDKTLVDRLLAGEQAAEFELDRRWRTRLFALARTILNDHGLAEDAAQIALWRAILNLGRYDPARAFGPWILAIAGNVARDMARRRRPSDGRAESLGPIPGPGQQGVQVTAQKEELAALRICIDGLRDRSRVVVGLHMAELSLSAMGTLLGEAKTTVQGWVRAAMDQLRRCLEQKGFKDIV